jgi:hypothetical protein
MDNRLSEAEVRRYERHGFLCFLLAVLANLAVAGCAGTGYAPAQDDQVGSSM